MVFQNWNEKYQIAPINTSSPNELSGIERCLHRWDIIFCSSSFPNSADLERKWDLSSLMLWCAPCQQARKTVGNFEKYISGSGVLPLFTFRKFSQFSTKKTVWEICFSGSFCCMQVVCDLLGCISRSSRMVNIASRPTWTPDSDGFYKQRKQKISWLFQEESWQYW